MNLGETPRGKMALNPCGPPPRLRPALRPEEQEIPCRARYMPRQQGPLSSGLSTAAGLAPPAALGLRLAFRGLRLLQLFLPGWPPPELSHPDEMVPPILCLEGQSPLAGPLSPPPLPLDPIHTDSAIIAPWLPYLEAGPGALRQGRHTPWLCGPPGAAIYKRTTRPEFGLCR